MADAKISALTDGVLPEAADILPAVRGAGNVRWTVAQLESYLNTFLFDRYNTYADLPAATGSGVQVVVLTTTGIIGFRNLAGFYHDAGVGTWNYLGLYGRSAAEIANVPAGTISATDVQGAINELDGDVQAHIGSGGTHHAQVTGATDGFMIAADKTKLDGVATGATANSSDATLLARANHTGTQAIATVLAAATARIFGRITGGSGAGEELTGTQATTLLDVFTSALKGLVPASGGGTTNFLRADGTWAPAGGGGGGSSINSGTTTVDFGTFPGAPDAATVVTGQTSIAVTSIVKAYIQATDSADHSADEHWLEAIDITAGEIVAGVGFTIRAKCVNALLEPYTPPNPRAHGGVGKGRQEISVGINARLYGQYNVAWEWI